MTKAEYKQQIQKQLEQGNLELALKVLQQYASAFAPKRQNDVAVLKATFSNAKRQFEVKGLMTRSEYDLVFARTVNGIQNIIGEETTDFPKISKQSSNRWMWITIGILLFLVLPFASYLMLKNGANSSSKQTESLLLDTIVQENTAVQIPAETAVEIEKEKPPIQPKEKSQKDNKPQEKEEVPITKETEPKPRIEKHAEEAVEYLEVKLIVNADYSNTKIFVDGKAATVLHNTAIIKTIRVEKKEEMHHIELKNGERPCDIDLLITKNGQKITMNC